VTSAINRPILYLGIGQAAKDLEEFDVKKMIKRIIGP
jgi:signal recognition particle GTPase